MNYDGITQIKLDDIRINQEYLKLVPRMKRDDDLAFDESIKQNGVQDPLTLNHDMVLLDGHSRYKKAEKYNLQSVPCKFRSFDNKLLEKKYVVECNLARRHLTNYQKVELGMALLEIETELATKRKHSTLKQNKDPIGSNDPIGEKGKAVEIVAKKVGLSSTTMQRGKAVMDKATDEQKEKLREGKTSINTIYNEITRKDRNLPKVSLPVGKWSVVMCDLPIEFDNKGVRGSSSNNYDTIPLPELKLGIFDGRNVRELFDDACVIFAWFQASTIFSAKDVLSSWGFECKTNIVWNKSRIGNGFWLKNMHEHLVIGVKGTIPMPAERVESIHEVEPENRINSSKPSYFYSLVEKLYPGRKYLDLFSRYKHNDSWTCFGNEIMKAEG
jgi:N6-adenosine-specific RNA methylase IME4